MFRLMGGLFTSRWFPLWVEVAVVANESDSEVEVLGTDQKDRYMYEVSVRRGERSVGERTFNAQFQLACTELSGTIATP
jgi:hypothetical protein